MMYKGKKLLFINWIDESRVYPFHLAKKRHLEIYLATTSSFTKEIEDLFTSNNIIPTNPYDSERLIIDVVNYQKENDLNFDAVTTFHEFNVIQTASLAKVLGLPSLSITSARFSSSNKFLMLEEAQKADILTPSYSLFNGIDSGYKALKNFKLPVVLKPVASASGFGAVKLDNNNYKKFKSAYNRAKEQLHRSIWEAYDYSSLNNVFLLQEYISGEVVSVEAIVQNGNTFILGDSSYDMSPEPRFSQEGVFIPGKISNGIRQKCYKITKKLISQLKLNHCAIHCEFRINKKNPIFLEIAARAPGGQMMRGYQESLGIDIAGLVIDLALGKKISTPRKRKRTYVVQRAIHTHKHGLVTKVIGIDQVKNTHGAHIFYHVKEGNIIKTARHLLPTIIFYQAKAKNRKKLSEVDTRIKSIIDIDTKPKFITLIFWRDVLTTTFKGLRRFLSEVINF